MEVKLAQLPSYLLMRGACPVNVHGALVRCSVD